MEDQVYDLFSQSKNIFLHGAAGTGKTYMIRKLINLVNRTTQECVFIGAPTGLAATHIGGSTIHSLFNLPCFNLNEKLIKHIHEYDYLECKSSPNLSDGPIKDIHELIVNMMHRSSFNENNLKYLIIDEISMTGASLLTLLDAILREKYLINEPMGGVQCIFSGDFCQLPPVKDEYCCFTKAWAKLNITQVDVNESKRFVDGSDYFNFICRLRVGKITPDDRNLIMERYRSYQQKDFSQLNIEPIMLYPTNREIDNINNKRLKEINNVLYKFSSSDEIKLVPGLTSDKKRKYTELSYKILDDIAPETLYFKVGAQIIFITNYDKHLKLVNGRMGKIIEINRVANGENRDDDDILTPDKISVDLADPNPKYNYKVLIEDIDGVRHMISPYLRSNVNKYVTCSRIQFPFKLAWAISIHRSQGMSVDAAIIDISNSFCDGQSYVAISRVTNANGLFISRVNLSKIKANKKIIEFFQLEA